MKKLLFFSCFVLASSLMAKFSDCMQLYERYQGSYNKNYLKSCLGYWTGPDYFSPSSDSTYAGQNKHELMQRHLVKRLSSADITTLQRARRVAGECIKKVKHQNDVAELEKCIKRFDREMKLLSDKGKEVIFGDF